MEITYVSDIADASVAHSLEKGVAVSECVFLMWFARALTWEIELQFELLLVFAGLVRHHTVA